MDFWEKRFFLLLYNKTWQKQTILDFRKIALARKTFFIFISCFFLTLLTQYSGHFKTNCFCRVLELMFSTSQWFWTMRKYFVVFFESRSRIFCQVNSSSAILLKRIRNPFQKAKSCHHLFSSVRNRRWCVCEEYHSQTWINCYCSNTLEKYFLFLILVASFFLYFFLNVESRCTCFRTWEKLFIWQKGFIYFIALCASELEFLKRYGNRRVRMKRFLKRHGFL